MLSITAKHVTYDFKCDNPACNRGYYTRDMNEAEFIRHLHSTHQYTQKDIEKVLKDLKYRFEHSIVTIPLNATGEQ